MSHRADLGDHLVDVGSMLWILSQHRAYELLYPVGELGVGWVLERGVQDGHLSHFFERRRIVA